MSKPEDKIELIIPPTVGRIVHYFDVNGVGPLAAVVVGVVDDRTVHLSVMPPDSSMFLAHNVHLVQPDDKNSSSYTMRAEWMPYQKQVAKGDIPPTLHA